MSKKTDSPDEDKIVFLGDAAFDTVALYKALLTGNTVEHNCHFSKAYIPLNTRSHLENVDYTINEQGISCCPRHSSPPMKLEGNKSNLRSGLPNFKFVCPQNEPVSSVETKNGTILTKYELLLKEISNVRKRLSVLPAGVHGTKKHYMQT